MDYNCGILLEKMRPKVEAVLKEIESEFHDLPHRGAPSQSLRAHHYLIAIETVDGVCSVLNPGLDEERCKRLGWRKLLSDFLAVHRTVSILEQNLYRDSFV